MCRKLKKGQHWPNSLGILAWNFKKINIHADRASLYTWRHFDWSLDWAREKISTNDQRWKQKLRLKNYKQGNGLRVLKSSTSLQKALQEHLTIRYINWTVLRDTFVNVGSTSANKYKVHFQFCFFFFSSFMFDAIVDWILLLFLVVFFLLSFILGHWMDRGHLIEST